MAIDSSGFPAIPVQDDLEGIDPSAFASSPSERKDGHDRKVLVESFGGYHERRAVGSTPLAADDGIEIHPEQVPPPDASDRGTISRTHEVHRPT
jgi:hypothetical protein